MRDLTHEEARTVILDTWLNYAERGLASLNLRQSVVPLSSTRLVDALSRLGEIRQVRVDPLCQLTDLSITAYLPDLRDLCAQHGQLRSLDGALPGDRVRRLNVADNQNLIDISGTVRLNQLTELNMEHCRGLAGIVEVTTLPLLHVLWLNGCTSIVSIESLERLRTLRNLSLDGVPVTTLLFCMAFPP